MFKSITLLFIFLTLFCYSHFSYSELGSYQQSLFEHCVDNYQENKTISNKGKLCSCIAGPVGYSDRLKSVKENISKQIKNHEKKAEKSREYFETNINALKQASALPEEQFDEICDDTNKLKELGMEHESPGIIFNSWSMPRLEFNAKRTAAVTNYNKLSADIADKYKGYMKSLGKRDHPNMLAGILLNCGMRATDEVKIPKLKSILTSMELGDYPLEPLDEKMAKRYRKYVRFSIPKASKKYEVCTDL